MFNTTNKPEEMLIKDVVETLKLYGDKIGEQPFLVSYRLEIDVSSLLRENINNIYLELIATLHWDVQLVRIKILKKSKFSTRLSILYGNYNWKIYIGSYGI